MLVAVAVTVTITTTQNTQFCMSIVAILTVKAEVVVMSAGAMEANHFG